MSIARGLASPQTTNLLARDSLADPRQLEYISRVRKTIEPDDLAQVENAVDVLKKPKRYESLKGTAENMIDFLADRYVPPNELSKMKGNPVKIANWIVKNRKTSRSVNRDSSGRYQSDFDIPNLLQPRK